MVEVALPTAAALPEVAAAPVETRSAESAPPDTTPTDPAPIAAAEQDLPSPSSPPSEPTQGAQVPANAEPAQAVGPEVNAEALQVTAAVGRYQIMVWSLASFTIGAALVAGLLLTRETETSDPKTIATEQPDFVEKDSPGLAPTTPAEPSVEEAPTPPPSTVQSNSDVPADVPSEPTPTTEQRVTIAPDSQVPPAPIAKEPSPQQKEVPPKPLANPRLARRFDPLDFDPENLSLDTVEQPSADRAVNESGNSVAPAVPEQAEVAAAETHSTLPLVRRGPKNLQGVSRRDAAEQLALNLAAVQFERIELVDCLRLFSQLSGVPVSIAPEQLLMAGITPRRKVSLDARETSLGEMLREVLQPLRLEYSTRGAQVVLHRQNAAKVREITYPVEDLVETGTSAHQLAQWVEQLIAPETWHVAEGKGTLTIDAESLQISHTQAVQYQVLILLERLRLSRGLPPKSRYPVERLTGTPANLVHEHDLVRATTFTFSQFTPFDEVVTYWQTELGIPLLVDWPALAEHEVWPSTTIACAIVDQPWSTALDKVLEPLDLGWRTVAGGAMEITSVEKVQSEMQLEVYAIRPGVDLSVVQLPADFAFLDSSGHALLVLQPAAAQHSLARQLQQLHILADQQ